MYESIFDMFLRIHFFLSMDLWDFTFKKLTQCVNICHIFFTDIEKKFSLKDLALNGTKTNRPKAYKG